VAKPGVIGEALSSADQTETQVLDGRRIRGERHEECSRHRARQAAFSRKKLALSGFRTPAGAKSLCHLARRHFALCDLSGLFGKSKTSTGSRTEQRPRAKRNNGGAMVNNVPVTTVWASRGKAAWSGFGPSDDDGSTTAGRAHLKGARSCFARWGAGGKVRQIEQSHGNLSDEPRLTPSTAVFDAAVAQLDAATMIKASQAASGEIELSKLIETLMIIAIEHAGAERSLLTLVRGETLQIEAKARFDQKTVEVELQQEAVTPASLPDSILQTVIRTQQSLILDDALAPNPFSADPYIRRKQARSVLCLPLMK
jgi:hypothetical protein